VDAAALDEIRQNPRLLSAWLRAGELGPLLEVLLEPRADLQWRLWLVRRVTELDPSRVVPVLVQLLSDDDYGVRGRAAEGLGCCVGKGVPLDEATEALLRCAEDDNEYVRVKALIALSYIGEQKAIPALLELAERPRYLTQRQTAVAALGRLGAPEAEAYFIGYLRERSHRGWAATWLEEIGTEASVDPLRVAARRDFLHRRDYRRAIEAIEARGA
jgi:HEAT repeat protein